MDIDNILNKFTIESLNEIKANGSIRLFLGNTCIISSVYGPTQTALNKAYEKGILEV
jgi:ribonuclease PH